MNIFPDYNVMEEAPQRNIKDQTATDYWLENGAYVNFDYVTLGWNVPIQKVQKLKKYVRSLRLAFTVNNLDDFRLFGSFAHDQQLNGQFHFGAG